MKKELQNLYLHTIESLQKNELDILEQNIKVFEALYETILKNSVNPKKSKILIELVRYINSVGEKLLDVGLLEKTSEIIKSFLDISNKYKIHSLNLDSLLVKMLKIIKETGNLNKIKDFSFPTILLKILENTGKYENYFEDNNISYYYSMYYHSISNNKYLNEDEKDEIINTILDELYYLPIYTIVKNNKDRINLLENIILVIFKAMIDNFDSKRISFSIKKLKDKHYTSNQIDLNKIFLTISTYLYYLAYKENFSSDVKQKYVSLLTGLNFKLESLLEYELDNFWIYYMDIKNELKKWEQFVNGESSKWLIMDLVVREFFLFITATDTRFNVKSFDIYASSEDELFLCLNILLEENNINTELLANYRVFKKVYGFNIIEEAEISELSLLKEYILGRYKNIHFKKVREYNKISLIESTNDIENLLIKNIEQNNLIEILNLGIEKLDLNTMKISLIKEIYPTQYFSKNDNINHFLSRICQKRIFDFLIHKFEQCGFVYDILTYGDTQKIDRLFKMINDVEGKKFYSINSLIDGLTDNNFFYTEDEKDIKVYKDFTKGLEHYYKTNDESVIIGFDNRYNKFKISNININIRSLNEDEVNHFLSRLEVKENQFKINIVNDIFVFFENDEAKEYIHLAYKVLEIEIEVALKIKEGSGFIFNLGYKL